MRAEVAFEIRKVST